ncbi:hypothetical protein M378DRAFT_62550, partial [Amanita muscaria Koide BX008]
WLKDDIDSTARLSPLLRQTRLQLLEWSKDPKAILTSILNSSGHVSFPESEWMAIIKGHAVNLGKVHTHRLSVTTSTKEPRRVAAGIDIVIGEPEPARRVRTAHEWEESWYRFDAALSFVSPHRREELRDYHTWIRGRFEAYHESAHHRVLTLDRKIRVEVASRRDIALNDFSKFAHFEISFIHDLGTGYLSLKANPTNREPGGGDGFRTQKVQVPCNRFNQNRCLSALGKCKYLHICSRCRKAGHGVEKC